MSSHTTVSYKCDVCKKDCQPLGIVNVLVRRGTNAAPIQLYITFGIWERDAQSQDVCLDCALDGLLNAIQILEASKTGPST